MESSRKLLEALWDMDADAVATGIEKAHEEISILQYNDENSLSCTICLLYTSSGVFAEKSGGEGSPEKIRQTEIRNSEYRDFLS